MFAVLFFSFFSWKSRKFIRWCKLNASLNYNVMYWYSPQVLYIFLVCLHKKFLPKIFLLNANPRNFVTICNVGKWFECFWSTWGYKPYWYKRKDILKTLWNYLRWNFLAKIVSAFWSKLFNSVLNTPLECHAPLSNKNVFMNYEEMMNKKYLNRY